eukprot:snap_masked-scaffold_23-processed-gene-0.37-mRNA-1 protein AED:1.00 eAED:1.00 QI:0/-1/0/0/-1/1/1/0/74
MKVDVLLKWYANFGMDPYFLLVTDNRSHFANDVLEDFIRRVGFESFLLKAYSLWINVATEASNSMILKHIRFQV